MTFKIVLDLLEEIANTSSRTAKEALIGPALKTNPTFKWVCQAAYDPFITYGITWGEGDLPLKENHLGRCLDLTLNGGDLPTVEEVRRLLARLAARELTGNAARAALAELIDRSDLATTVVIRRILNKDLRAGFTATTLNKLSKGLIPEFSCMLAHKFSAKRIKQWPVGVEPKLDGVRLLARVGGGDVQFFSRNGKQEFASMPRVAEALVALKVDGWFDGEVTVPGGFNETVSQVRTKDAVLEHAVYTVFEYLTFNEFEVGCNVVYLERLRRLAGMLVVKGSNTWLKASAYEAAHNSEQVHAIYEDMLAQGLEGVIVKPLNGLYVKKRSHDWMKIKAEETLDLKVVGAFEGEGKYVGMLGGLIVDHNGVLVRVGSGFSDQQRVDLWNSYCFDELHPEFDPKVVGSVAEIMYHEITPDGSLRHPRFKCFRFDKTYIGFVAVEYEDNEYSGYGPSDESYVNQEIAAIGDLDD